LSDNNHQTSVKTRSLKIIRILLYRNYSVELGEYLTFPFLKLS